MVFTTEDRILIKVLRQTTGYSARKLRCEACSSNASTAAGVATSTTSNSVSSRSDVASTRTSLTEQFDSGVFDYAHVSVQMAATLSTN